MSGTTKGKGPAGGGQETDAGRRELSEKIKELAILYEISDVIDRRGRPFEEIIEGVLAILPRITSEPEETCGRIVIDGKEHLTSNFEHTPWVSTCEITARLNVVGSVEVFRLNEKAAPFTEAEKTLIRNIASRLGRVVARKRSEEMLSESEERYRSLFEDSRDAIYTVSSQGVILDANQAAFDLFGYTRSEMLGMRAVLLYDEAGSMESFEAELQSKGSVRNFEVRLKRKNCFVMDCLCTSSVRKSHPEGSVIGYHSILRDITESKIHEREKLELITELTTALDSIRTLKGLIPICAACKKIRDDKGYWNRLEEYIEAQTEAVFSHGLCPECQKRFEEED